MIDTALPLLLTERQLAALLQVKPGTLRTWRAEGKGPPARRMGDKIIRYHRDDVRAWIDGQPKAGGTEEA